MWLILAKGESLTLLAGQVDQADPSHFVIPYITGSGRGTIDGWLQKDNSLKIGVRDGPLAATELQWRKLRAQ